MYTSSVFDGLLQPPFLLSWSVKHSLPRGTRWSPFVRDAKGPLSHVSKESLSGESLFLDKNARSCMVPYQVSLKHKYAYLLCIVYQIPRARGPSMTPLPTLVSDGELVRVV